MQVCIYRSDDQALLDQIVASFRPGRPIFNEKNQRIGSVVRIWRKGDILLADCEVALDQLRRGPIQSVGVTFLLQRKKDDE